MRVIFLDIDGVLNSRAYKNKMKAACSKLGIRKEEALDIYICDSMIKRLSKLYKKYYGTVLVLSSSWKDFDKNDSMYIYLIEKLNEFGMKIYDSTPCCTDSGELCTTRPQEIEEWFKLHKDLNVKYWVSLDDDFNHMDYDKVCPGFSKHLCKTEYGDLDSRINETGLSNIKYHEALEILGGILD